MKVTEVIKKCQCCWCEKQAVLAVTNEQARWTDHACREHYELYFDMGKPSSQQPG